MFKEDPDVFTLSVHAARNFPFRKQGSDLDISLDDGVDDAAYLAMLAETLPRLLDDFKPELVLYDAGIDPHMDDKLGKSACF